MMNGSNTTSSGTNAQAPGLKTHFKTPEGKYKLHCEKTYPLGLPNYAHGKTVTQVTLAHLKEKTTQAPSQPSSSLGVTSGVRSAAARLLGGGNGSRSLSFVGGNGGNKLANGTSSKIGSLGTSSSNNVVNNSNFDGPGSYVVFNVGDAILIGDLNSQEKDPIKLIHFNSNPVCHAFDPEAKDGHDLLIGLSSGDVYSVSLRQQLQEVGKKLVGAHHYNKDGSVNNSRCTCIEWIPNGTGSFIVAHVDGSMYVYEKNKDGSADHSFPLIKDPTQFSVSHARYSKNPVSRWHICQGSLNGIAFSTDGAYIATVGRDGYLRVFDYKTEELICGGKSYYGALLCCAWSPDGKYILAGGEDDLVQVWSMEDKKIVAWGEGHNSLPFFVNKTVEKKPGLPLLNVFTFGMANIVSGVAFDSFWVAPNSDGTEENIVYRFGSVGQDTQILLWDLEMGELVVPVRRAPGGSPTFSVGSQSAHWDSACPVGTLKAAPSTRDVPKLSPLVAHRVHTEPLSGLIFARDSVLTICREGHIKIWKRPCLDESQSIESDILVSTSLKEKPLVPAIKV